ncbi:hypothetical protein C8J57DRAFT_1432524 [Mycena rebaudengoi]|nr:hypothetical protein C8J57DRAFT_1432524 [Mycena rebaudengoi]
MERHHHSSILQPNSNLPACHELHEYQCNPIVTRLHPSFSSNQDPAGVKALLDKLRTSQAWQNLVQNQEGQSTSSQSDASVAQSATVAPPSASVAALLSQLNSSSTRPPAHASAEPQPIPFPASEPPAQAPAPGPAPRIFSEDVRSLTFQQALPRIAELSENSDVASTIEKLRKEQNEVERQLNQERQDIRTKYEEKVKVAKTKATMIGTGLSKHEAEMLSQAYEKELKRFDAERVLPAWDGLVTKQQTALARLQIPTMFPTTVKADRERQQRVIQVLEGIF